MKTTNVIELLKNNSVFWSKLGFCYDPPRLDENGKPIVFFEDFERFAKYHKDFSQAGIKIHTSILFSGWVGVGKYDYELTDKVLNTLFKSNPDVYYIPRIKLNVPLDWGKENPEDVFVYYGGPENAEEIRQAVGTSKHDYLGYDSPIGYYTAGDWDDDRPNVGGVISNQSFSSQKWLKDAGEALSRIIRHLEEGPYSDKILAYHIAYGSSGETCLWGRCSRRFGDYGIANRKAFFDWGMAKYGSLDVLKKVWKQANLTRNNATPPSPQRRQPVNPSIRDFFRADEQICVDYDRFMSDVNVNAIEHFAKIIKQSTDKLVGCFYAYFLESDNAAYTGWLEIERVLNSPYVDFLAAPKSYYRNAPGEPGGEIGPAQSVNRKKIWMDELDIRTHLCVTGEKQCEDMAETRTYMWREFSKNMAHGSNFWWMDLGNGWFDSPEILREVGIIEKNAACIRRKPNESVAEILLVIDEEAMYHTVNSISFHWTLMRDMVRNTALCGMPTDLYRLNDLETLDLTQYKLIIFLNIFKLLPEQWQRINERIAPQTTLFWNYAPGVLKPKFSLANIAATTGMKVKERQKSDLAIKLITEPDSLLTNTKDMCLNESEYIKDIDYPVLEIAPDESLRVLARYEDGAIAVASGEHNNHKIVYSVLPFFQPEHINCIANFAGCHHYAPLNCTVYADKRFISVFPKVDMQDEKIELKNEVFLKSAITGIKTKKTKSIPLDLKAKEMEFFLINY